MNETPLQQLLSITLIFISNQEKWKPIRHVLIRVLKLERLRTQLHHNHHQAHLRQSLHLNKKLHFCYHKLFPFSHFNQMLFIREYVFNLTKAHLGQSDTFSNLYKASSIWFLWLFQHVPIYLADRRCCGLRIVNTIYNSQKSEFLVWSAGQCLKQCGFLQWFESCWPFEKAMPKKFWMYTIQENHKPLTKTEVDCKIL